MTKYKTVHLPAKLVNQITPEMLKTNGYTSRPEFIKDSIRDKLEKLKNFGEEAS